MLRAYVKRSRLRGAPGLASKPSRPPMSKSSMAHSMIQEAESSPWNHTSNGRDCKFPFALQIKPVEDAINHWDVWKSLWSEAFRAATLTFSVNVSWSRRACKRSYAQTAAYQSFLSKLEGPFSRAPFEKRCLRTFPFSKPVRILETHLQLISRIHFSGKRLVKINIGKKTAALAARLSGLLR